MLPGIFKHNKLFDDFCWMGAQDMPFFDEDVLVDDTCRATDVINYEICLDDWWPSFTADFTL